MIRQQDLIDEQDDLEEDNQLGAEFAEQIKHILLACVEKNRFDDDDTLDDMIAKND